MSRCSRFSLLLNRIIVKVSGCISRGIPTDMPTTYAETYFPVLIQILIALAVAGGMIGVSAMLGRKVQRQCQGFALRIGNDAGGYARANASV